MDHRPSAELAGNIARIDREGLRQKKDLQNVGFTRL
jgi:hypothetical protein